MRPEAFHPCWGGPCIGCLFFSFFPFESSLLHISNFIRMGLLDRLRARPRHSAGSSTSSTSAVERPSPRGSYDPTKKLPRPVLARIFAEVCPHAVDTSYDTSEESMTDGCMLCDMRDLAHCAQVCKRWFLEARYLL